MVVQNNTMITGGNSLYLWAGQWLRDKVSIYLAEIGDKWIKKGQKTIISNVEGKFINAFSIIITFTIQPNEKNQLILQSGSYLEHYIANTGELKLTEDELFLIIHQNEKMWFRRTNES